MADARVLAKCDRIHTEGLRAIGEGKLPLFSGFPPSLEKRFNASVIFTRESTLVARERLIEPIKEKSRQLGLRYFLADADFPFHSTLKEAEWKGEVGTLDRDFEAAEKTASALSSGLVGETFEYSLLLAGGNVLLCSDEVPPKVEAFRSELEKSLGQSFSPLPLDFLHSTLCRLKTCGGSVAMVEYAAAICKLRIELAENPLELKVERVYCGSALSLLNSI